MYEYYRVLGVAKDATAAQIKKAYRKMAKKFHPDLHPNDENAQKKIQEINDAYTVLGDEEKRKQYDAGQQEKAKSPFWQKEAGRHTATYNPTSALDFGRMQGEFEHFFGFDPKSGEITREEKLKGKNPLDVSGLFEKFMGFK